MTENPIDKLRTVECDRAILIIRHGEKVPPTEDDPFKDVKLTEGGKHNSFRLGEEIRHMVSDCKILSSPLKRCTQTAENIVKGYGAKNCTMETSPMLGGPGPYVEDEVLAGETYLGIASQNRNVELIEMQLQHRSLPGFRSIEEGSRLLMGYILGRCDIDVCIAITHDTIILPLIGFLCEELEEMEKRIDYLNGILFCIRGENVVMHTKETSFDITQKLDEIGVCL